MITVTFQWLKSLIPCFGKGQEVADDHNYDDDDHWTRAKIMNNKYANGLAVRLFFKTVCYLALIMLGCSLIGVLTGWIHYGSEFTLAGLPQASIQTDIYPIGRVNEDTPLRIKCDPKTVIDLGHVGSLEGVLILDFGLVTQAANGYPVSRDSISPSESDCSDSLD